MKRVLVLVAIALGVVVVGGVGYVLYTQFVSTSLSGEKNISFPALPFWGTDDEVPPSIGIYSVVPGDTLGKMVVESIGPFQSDTDIPFGPTNLTIRLKGPIEVTGVYTTADSGIGDGSSKLIRFDEKSLKRLPRSSLMFESGLSPQGAVFLRDQNQALGTLGDGSRLVTVVIDAYDLTEFPSEVVDSAELIKVVSKGPLMSGRTTPRPQDSGYISSDTREVMMGIAPFSDRTLAFRVSAPDSSEGSALDNAVIVFDKDTGYIRLVWSRLWSETSLLRLHTYQPKLLIEEQIERIAMENFEGNAEEFRERCSLESIDYNGWVILHRLVDQQVSTNNAYCGNSPFFVVENLLVEYLVSPTNGQEPRADLGSIYLMLPG